jgi:flagellin
MGLRINTNILSLQAQRSLANNNRKNGEVLNSLSSGTRINKAADDSAGMAIATKLNAKIKGTMQAERNANDGISLIQTAEGGLDEISNILVRLRELAVQSSSDTIGKDEREFTDLEYQNLKKEISRISASTDFNGKKLLNGEGDFYEFQIGVNNDPFLDRIGYDSAMINAGIENLDMTSLTVSSKQDSQESLSVIDDAIQKISGNRAFLGAIQSRLGSTIQNLQSSIENQTAAKSRIKDTDYARASAERATLNVLTNAGTAVLAQANASSQQALKLLG